ncbi:Transcriptional repressor of aga operon [Indibacter alkaliphilus LW1]|uniref:Transcriptional repressor of aga operon n=1 Tax=Indibacter alkaliphilus (strain CCUG 57479 / KCTC 22604 / LW1) TaxID=1189612 RepID=S2DTB2_INDAL|nr:DeoR/GlpR family DNA-binding transcription regulator [Indibacter alkaliphilus]EOZ95326.1 Transcriptional repressor of aga operon [Indibacter alkaliphilus LW1]
MIGITERHQIILRKLKEEGKVNILDLSQEMNVSSVTIRKDLKALEEMNLLYRTRGGGSVHTPYTVERSIYEKASINAEEKQKIAKAATTLVKSQHDSLIIGSGTTVFEFSRQLMPNHPITVITPAAKVTIELSNKQKVEVFQLGGLIRPNSSSVAGVFAEKTLEGISCGLVFLGVDGIDLDFGFTITNLSEASLNQKMIDASQTVVILADHTKFNRRGLGRICGFEQVDYLITDDKAPRKEIAALEEKGIKVIIA